MLTPKFSDFGKNGNYYENNKKLCKRYLSSKQLSNCTVNLFNKNIRFRTEQTFDYGTTLPQSFKLIYICPDYHALLKMFNRGTTLLYLRRMPCCINGLHRTCIDSASTYKTKPLFSTIVAIRLHFNLPLYRSCNLNISPNFYRKKFSKMANNNLFIYIFLFRNYVYNTRKHLSYCRILDYYIAFASVICCENTNERRTHKMISQLLCACAAFSWTIQTSIASILLFGEYPYPTEDNAE